MSVQDEYNRMVEMQDNFGADKYPLKEFNFVGRQNVRRVDGIEKASGRARYTMDVELHGMLHMKFLTSPYPNAEIKNLDTKKAEALPGVRGILRYDDPEIPMIADLSGHLPIPGKVLPNVAHFQGEPVGLAVAADTEDIAEEAIRLLEVEWKLLPFVLDVEEALKPGSPLAFPEGSYVEMEGYDFPKPGTKVEYSESLPDYITAAEHGEEHGVHILRLNEEGRDNVESEHVEGLGDVKQGFAEADRVVEFTAQRHLHTWISPERPCGVIRWNGDSPEVWLKHQRPHEGKRSISHWFGGIPMHKIQLHMLYQGGTFGGWTQMYWKMGPDYCAALLAKRTGRPVKWTFSRRDDFYGGSMDAGYYFFRIGFKKDGTITAVQTEGHFANPMWYGHGPATHFIENTRIPHVDGLRKCVKVNKGPTTAVRCEQLPMVLPMTLVSDRVAAELNMDPIEVALKNDGVKGHDMAWAEERKKEMGFIPRDSLRECVEKGMAAIDWNNKWHPPGTKRLSNGRMHGLGFTWTHEWDDSGGSGEISMRVERNDGRVSILGMRCDCGVNAETTYCQIAADELGMRVEDVNYRPQVDTGFFTMTPDGSTNASVNGWAVRHCARLLKAKILQAVTAPRSVSQRGNFPPFFPDMKPEDLDIKDSVIYVKADPSKRLPMAELVGPAGGAGPLGFYEVYGSGKHPFSVPLFAHSYQYQLCTYGFFRPKWCRQAHFMEVEVDIETGEIEIKKVVNVNDVGKAISPEACAGQQYGGSYMGPGRGLFEEVVYDPITGVMLNGNLLDYKITTIGDSGPIDTHLVETAQGYGPYGLVGIGEDIATVVPALLSPAVYNAIGVWIYDFPITPARVLEALKKI